MLMFQNTTCEKQVILLIIPNRERWHYLAETKLSALLRAITSKHHGDLYCLNFVHSFATGNKRDFHRKPFANKYFCNAVMLSEDTKILEFNQYQKYDKTPFIMYLECFKEKTDECKNNPGNPLIKK